MFLRCLFFIAGLFFLIPISGQVEVNPYVGFVPGKDRLSTTGGDLKGSRYLLGIDALLGAGQLAPLGGLFYVQQRYEGGASGDFSYGRVHLPLGVAYRLLAPDFDLNLVPSLALAPGLTLGSDAAPDFMRELDWSLRAGARLYLDTVTVGVHYLLSLTDHYPEGKEDPAGVVLTLGARF
ncbi:hypothetical protein [Neolewinella litorea]|uniref:Acyloxyacyl hydrolase n=1 Tax=Neolewinella litorea TaxID=2562452 RepID=A0A4S4NN86_9BACT|nr:hypothetical protein [Neolewinella litorea]THH40457.1 hypothetical protein E4021_06900 [Neolewinella litorea]